jgi:hypothetical protein
VPVRIFPGNINCPDRIMVSILLVMSVCIGLMQMWSLSSRERVEERMTYMIPGQIIGLGHTEEFRYVVGSNKK